MSSDTPDLLSLLSVFMAVAASQAEQITALKDENTALKALVFGSRSERTTVILQGQLDLEFGDLGPPPEPANDAPAQAPVTASPQRERRHRQARRNLGRLPLHLPRIDEIIEPRHTACPCCAGALHRIGEEIAEALDAVPAILRVRRTIRPKYACRACEDGVVQAPARARPISGGMVTTALLASVAVWKFSWSMPLSRQVSMLAGHGVHLDRSTLGRWMKKAAWWLRPLYERLLVAVHRADRIFCDETPLPVRRPGLKRTHKAQFWAHVMDDRPWGGPSPPAVVYIHADGRSHREIETQLADWQGLLQVDGYAVYKKLAHPDRTGGPITLAFCLAHARRKFVEVHQQTSSPIAADIIRHFAAIYAIEGRIRGRSAEERRAWRQAHTAPLMADLKSRLEAELMGLSRQSNLAKAIRYTLGHWEGLTRCLNDGRLEVDSNTVERTMRLVALGRRNFLFAGNDGGAQTWAILASLLNTARLNDVDPFTWLNDVLEKIVSGDVKATDLDQLLVWNWKAARETARLAA
jgi:transposase